MAEASPRFRVGYALAPKKIQSFIQQSFIDCAKKRGIDLVRIIPEVPLVEQGPFDCVIQKLYGQEWRKQLADFAIRNPRALIFDPPDAIQRLHSRISMLQVVSEIKIDDDGDTFGIPLQVVIYDSDSLSNPPVWGGLRFPVIAKPLVADGSAKSHKMSLVFSDDAMSKLKPPLVLQEFVNHGGVIFKVYVVGEHVQCVKRRSLPDVSEEKLGSLEGSVSFSQISNLSNQDKNCDDYCMNLQLEETEYPPHNFIVKIAKGLREALALNLFNFDVIRDTRVGSRYLIIDINYFPGYAKMPDYESVLTDFLWEVVHQNVEGGADMSEIGCFGGEEICSQYLLQ